MVWSEIPAGSGKNVYHEHGPGASGHQDAGGFGNPSALGGHAQVHLGAEALSRHQDAGMLEVLSAGSWAGQEISITL